MATGPFPGRQVLENRSGMPAIPDLNRGRRLSTNAAITNLLMTIASGAMRPDDPLYVQRMTHNKARKAALETDVLNLERQLATSMVRITEEMIHAFGDKMAHALRDGSNQFRSEHVRLFVDRAELSTAGSASSGR